MKRFFATTAMVMVIGNGAFAETHSQGLLDYQYSAETSILASDLIGMRVYATEQEMENNQTIAADGEKEWDDIGEVNEVVLMRDGTVGAVIIGVGGFLGMGEKDVAVSMDQIRFVNEEGDDDYFLVVNTSQEMLEQAKAFERNEDMDAENMDNMDKNADKSEERDQSQMREQDANADRRMLVRPDIRRDGFVAAEKVELTSENLTGARVYDTNDEDIGEVSELLLSDDGQVTEVIIDVGGFIGIGEKPVAVTFEELNIQRTEDGTEFRVYIDATEEALENQPTYEG